MEDPMAAEHGIVSHEVSVMVDRPAADVSRYLTNPANIPQSSDVVSEVEALPAGQRIDAGTKLRANLGILGLRMTVDGEVVDFDPARRRRRCGPGCTAARLRLTSPSTISRGGVKGASRIA
jgi:hypothetical protein